MDRIILKGLPVGCVIGTLPEERTAQQTLFFDLELYGDFSRAGRTDDLNDAVDYTAVERCVKDYAAGTSFHLLERLAYLTDVNATQDRLKHILIVDDDETFLKTVKNWLSRQYRVTIVTSGAQAMMYVADNQPDLILLDYEMPVTSGPQVLEMLRSEPKTAKIPVIFLTGKGDRDSVFQVLALKPEGYILKSSGRDKLVESVGSFFMKQLYDKLHD